jgi:hypothetical protein
MRGQPARGVEAASGTLPPRTPKEPCPGSASVPAPPSPGTPTGSTKEHFLRALLQALSAWGT